jgi:hypothetical protein
MIEKHKLWLLVTVIIIAAMSLFACTPAETLTPTEAPPEEAPTEAPPAVEPTEAPPPEEEPTEAPPPEEEPTEPPPPAEETSIVILVPDNPVAFNGINTDTGYEQAMGELVMLSLAESDPDGNIYPE